MKYISGCVCPCSSWDGKQGPVKDAYSLANNPQYRLEVTCPAGGTAVWVLLTRHITDKVHTVCLAVHHHTVSNNVSFSPIETIITLFLSF